MEERSTQNAQSHLFPGKALYRYVRAGFVSQGTSLQAWCELEGIYRQNARKCLLGEWRGAKATALVARLVAAVGGSNAS